MSTARGGDEWRAARGPLFLAVGFFDGVHRGHAALIGEAVRRARERAGQAWALTFDPHPLRVLRPADAPPTLTTTATRLRLIRALGVDGCALTPFTPEFSRQSPESFVAELRRAAPTLAGVVVGPNWRFGREARGDADLLRALGRQAAFEVIVVPAVQHRGEPISSTRIRRAVAAGDVEEAAAMLGRPFAAEGIVVEGRRVGRTLGYPTANLQVENELLPPPGVYAARLRLADGRNFPAAAYRGARPTFGAADAGVLLEAHALDADLALYGERVELDFLRRLREDRRFNGPEDLRAQIAEDLRAVRAVLEEA